MSMPLTAGFQLTTSRAAETDRYHALDNMALSLSSLSNRIVVDKVARSRQYEPMGMVM